MTSMTTPSIMGRIREKILWWKPEMRLRRARCILDDDPKFTCCGCCHVQTGTICMGVYNLLLQLICMSVLIFAILHPEVLMDGNKSLDQIDFEIKAPVPISSNEDDKLTSANESGLKPALEPYAPIGSGASEGRDRSGETLSGRDVFFTRQDMLFFTRRRVESGDAHLALALVFGLLIITLLMIYGAIKSRPVYLLPFFCFQVFDFILACLTAVGHYTWLPNIHQVIVENPEMPFREQLLNLNSEWLALCILLVYVLVLMVKAYFIGIVWACYQYLHLRNASVLRYTEVEGTTIPNDAELLLPPDYETASKMPPVYPGPPPMYTSS